MNRSILIERYDFAPLQTLGRLFVLDDGYRSIYDCDTLELPWKNNAVRKSRIPVGTYKVVKRTSPKFGLHFHLTDTPGRQFILIHAGNTFKDIEGCILVGKDLKDIDRDGNLDVIKSKETLSDLIGLLPSEFELKIIEL